MFNMYHASNTWHAHVKRLPGFMCTNVFVHSGAIGVDSTFNSLYNAVCQQCFVLLAGAQQIEADIDWDYKLAPVCDGELGMNAC